MNAPSDRSKGNKALASVVDPEEVKRESTVLGGMLIDPTFACGAVAAAHGAPGFAHWRTITSSNVADALEAMIEAVRGGDMSSLEAMLVSQAVALQSIFADSASRARAQNSREASGSLMGIAMKAQAQCRATLQTLAEIKNPRTTVFTKQANVNAGSGNQQVNNSVPIAHAPAREEPVPMPSELLAITETGNGGTILEPGTACEAGRGDQKLEPVGVIDRASKPRGKSRVCA